MIEHEPHEPIADCDCRECAVAERNRLRQEVDGLERWDGRWNPLADDGDALRLANKRSIDILHNWESVTAQWGLGKFCREKCTDETRDEATRRAITRAAAEIGKAMP